MRRAVGAPMGLRLAVPEPEPALNIAARSASTVEFAAADALVATLKADLLRLSHGDPRALFTLRRRVLARLKQDDDGAPSRRKLQVVKYAEQGGICATCGLPLSRAGALLHRRDPRAGFTIENTLLAHGDCEVTPVQVMPDDESRVGA